MFNRRAIEDIKAWYQQNKRKPLVIRGARQVGKTTAVRLAAEQLFVKVIEVNLERHTELEPLFQRYKLDELLFNFSLMSGEQIMVTPAPRRDADILPAVSQISRVTSKYGSFSRLCFTRFASFCAFTSCNISAITIPTMMTLRSTGNNT